MTAPELMQHYAGMIDRVRSGRRITILGRDGILSDWTLVIKRIANNLERGDVSEWQTLERIIEEKTAEAARRRRV